MILLLTNMALSCLYNLLSILLQSGTALAPGDICLLANIAFFVTLYNIAVGTDVGVVLLTLGKVDHNVVKN